MVLITDSWGSPSWLMEIFEDWYDPCPLEDQHYKGLEFPWKDKTYVNPPYSNPLPWVEKAIAESKLGKTIVMLLKVDTSTKWFQRLVEAKAKIFWLNGRIKFRKYDYVKGKTKETPAGFPSMLVVLSKTSPSIAKPNPESHKEETEDKSQ